MNFVQSSVDHATEQIWPHSDSGGANHALWDLSGAAISSAIPHDLRERRKCRVRPAALHRRLQREAPILGARLPEPGPLRGRTAPQPGQNRRLNLSGSRGPLQYQEIASRLAEPSRFCLFRRPPDGGSCSVDLLRYLPWMRHSIGRNSQRRS